MNYTDSLGPIYVRSKSADQGFYFEKRDFYFMLIQ